MLVKLPPILKRIIAAMISLHREVVQLLQIVIKAMIDRYIDI